MNTKNIPLDQLGDWQDPTPPGPHEVGVFLGEMLARCEEGMRNVDTTEFLTALLLAHKELSSEEYFSDTGQKLATRHLCHALAAALDLEVNIAFADKYDAATFAIAEMTDLHMFRDGGSLEFHGVLGDESEFALFLQVGTNFDGDRAHYRELYPAGHFDRHFYQPIPKGGTEEKLILDSLRRLENSGASPSDTTVPLGDFIAAIEDRKAP